MKKEDPKNNKMHIALSSKEMEVINKFCNDIPQAKRIIFKFGIFTILNEGVHKDLVDLHNNLVNITQWERMMDDKINNFYNKVKEVKK